MRMKNLCFLDGAKNVADLRIACETLPVDLRMTFDYLLNPPSSSRYFRFFSKHNRVSNDSVSEGRELNHSKRKFRGPLSGREPRAGAQRWPHRTAAEGGGVRHGAWARTLSRCIMYMCIYIYIYIYR